MSKSYLKHTWVQYTKSGIQVNLMSHNILDPPELTPKLQSCSTSVAHLYSRANCLFTNKTLEPCPLFRKQTRYTIGTNISVIWINISAGGLSCASSNSFAGYKFRLECSGEDMTVNRLSGSKASPARDISAAIENNPVQTLGTSCTLASRWCQMLLLQNFEEK